MSTYLWVDLLALSVPLLASFHPRLRFDRAWRTALPAILGMMALFVPWDAAFAAAGIWTFDPFHISGRYLLGLPVEEVLFFVCIPYACLFSYHCFQQLWPGFQVRRPRALSILLILVLVVVGTLYHDRIYTATTAWATAVWIAWCTFLARTPWMGRMYATYAVMLLPFALVNGMLTGMSSAGPVVHYAPEHLNGVRMGTIPVEDVFYGLLMFGLTVTFHESLRSRHTTTDTLPPCSPTTT